MKIKKIQHHPKFLQSTLDNFSYSLDLLGAITNKAKKSKSILEKNSHTLPIDEWSLNNIVMFNNAPKFKEITITIIGIACLLSVCDETAKQYKSKEINKKIADVKNNFDYKNIRDILTHWYEYSLCKGRLQNKGLVPKRAPAVSYSINDSIFKVYDYNVHLVNLFKNTLDIYDKTRALLLIEEKGNKC